MPKAIPTYIENTQGRRRRKSRHGVTRPGDQSGTQRRPTPPARNLPNPTGQATILPSQEGISPWSTLMTAREYDTVEARLHDEIHEFASWASPSPNEVKTNEAIIHAIGRSFKLANRSIIIRTAGSVENGLSLPDSNLDLEYWYPNESPYIEPLKEVSSLLVDSGLTHKKLVVTVPPHEGVSVRFLMPRELGGRLISLTKIPPKSAGASSSTIKSLLSQHAATRPLYLVVKAFLSQRGLTSAQDVNGMTSLGLVTLCARFLQVNPYNRATYDLSSPTRSLGILLRDFFNYFGFHNIKAVRGVLDNFNTRSQGQRPSKKRRTNTKALTAEIGKHFKAASNYIQSRTPIDKNILRPLLAMDNEMVNRRTAVIELLKSGSLEKLPIIQKPEPSPSTISMIPFPKAPFDGVANGKDKIKICALLNAAPDDTVLGPSTDNIYLQFAQMEVK